MPHDEGLAQRIREVLEDDPRVAEKRMFGGVAFLVNGAMAVGTLKDALMVRVGAAAYDAALALPHAHEMDFTGRPMRGFVKVAPAGFAEDDDLRTWIARGVAGAQASEPKPRRAGPSARKPAAKSSGRKRAPRKR